MERIRTLHITPSVRLLGARRSLLTLVKGLVGTHVDPLVLVPSLGGLTEEFDRLHIRYQVLKLSPWRKGASWFQIPGQIAALRKLVEREKIDLIHCNEIYPTPHAIVGAGSCGTNAELVVRAVHGRALKPMRIPVVTHMRLSVTPRMIRNYHLHEATRIIAVSHGAAADFNSVPWKAERVRVVHNGIELDEFAAARADGARIRAELGWRDENFVIGQIGLMMPRKRPRFLLDVAPGIIERVPQARFLFVGEPSPGQHEYLDELKRLAQERGVAEFVTFLPFQKKVAPYFAALDLNMLVSDDEGFGRVVIEAAAAGVPTVGSRVGGIPELIQDCETGFLLGNAGDTDEMFWREIPRFAEIVAELAGNVELRDRLAANAAENAVRNFSADQYVRGVVSVFHEAVQEFRRREDPW